MFDLIQCSECFYSDLQTRFCWMLESYFDEDFYCAYGQGFDDDRADFFQTGLNEG